MEQPLPLFIGKIGRRLPPSSPRRAGGFLRKFLDAPPNLISSLPFCTLRKSYGRITKAYRTWFSSFFVLPLTNLKWKRHTQGYGNFTEALRMPWKPFFNKKRGGGCRPARPGELGCFLLKIPSFQNVLEGPRFENCYLHPYYDRFTPLFLCFLDVFLLKPHRTLRIPRRWVLSLPKRSTTVSGWN